MTKHLRRVARLGVLTFAGVVSMLPTAAAALPTHEQLLYYLDANGGYIGERLTTCDGGNYLTGSTSSNVTVVYREPCDPPEEPKDCYIISGLVWCF